MRLLLLSRGAGAVPDFLGPDVAEITYVEDAAGPLGDAPFVAAEREQLERLGYRLRRVVCGDLTPDEARAAIERAEAVYLAGGLTDLLLDALRRSGAAEALVAAARRGVPVTGASAGAIVLGRSILPGLLLDGPTDGVDLPDDRAFGLVDTTVLPHADGQLPPYPAERIAQVRAALTGDVTLLPDDRALVVEDDARRMVRSDPAG